MKNDELLRELEELKSKIMQFQESIKRFENKLNEPESPKIKVEDICEILNDHNPTNHGFKVGEAVRVYGMRPRVVGGYFYDCVDSEGFKQSVTVTGLKILFSNG